MSNLQGTLEKDWCPKGCAAGSYLVPDTKECVRCPEGAFCPGNTDANGIKPKNGYWRVPDGSQNSNITTDKRPMFVKCINPCACLGAPNPEIPCPNRLVDHEEGCNTNLGHQPGSRICGNCMKGYSRHGMSECRKCGAEGINIFSLIMALLAVTACMVLLVWITVINNSHKVKVSDGAKKIFVSFLQFASLAAGMSIPWPENYVGLFRIQSMASSVGEELMDARCAMPPEQTLSIAHIEYYKMLSYFLLPPVITVIAIVSWMLPPCTRSYPYVQRKAMRTGTIVLLLYLAYPSITSHTLSMWNCLPLVSTTGEKTGLTVFSVDPETLCTSPEHKGWQAFGIFGIIIYILGMPLVAYMLLRKFRHKLDEPRTQMRFGFLYAGFKKEKYAHELWVALRKVLVIMISIFSDKLQVLFAIGVIGGFLVQTVLVKPFRTEKLSQLETLLLTCCFITTWMGGIFVVYPQCQDESSGGRTFCVIGEVIVLLMNIFCFVIALGYFVWLKWREKREMIVKLVDKGASKMSESRFCGWCCKSKLLARAKERLLRIEQNTKLLFTTLASSKFCMCCCRYSKFARQLRASTVSNWVVNPIDENPGESNVHNKCVIELTISDAEKTPVKNGTSPNLPKHHDQSDIPDGTEIDYLMTTIKSLRQQVKKDSSENKLLRRQLHDLKNEHSLSAVKQSVLKKRANKLIHDCNALNQENLRLRKSIKQMKLNASPS